MEITVYTTSTCPFCKMLMAYLGEKQLPYVELRVDTDKENESKMMQESGGFLGVPFTVIKKSDGTKETVIGFDKNKLDQILENR